MGKGQLAGIPNWHKKKNDEQDNKINKQGLITEPIAVPSSGTYNYGGDELSNHKYIYMYADVGGFRLSPTIIPINGLDDSVNYTLGYNDGSGIYRFGCKFHNSSFTCEIFSGGSMTGYISLLD